MGQELRLTLFIYFYLDPYCLFFFFARFCSTLYRFRLNGINFVVLYFWLVLLARLLAGLIIVYLLFYSYFLLGASTNAALLV